jgi:putative FmdB family regulatory protein
MIREQMPIYDFHCDHCGHSFSAVRSYTDEAPVACPSCGKVPRKLLTNPAIVFKGGGWYKTDSRPQPKEAGSDTSKEGAKQPAKDAGKDAPKDGASEAKPVETKTSEPAKTETAAPKSEAASS